MKQSHSITLGATALLLGLAATAQATVVDFDAVTAEVNLTVQYSGLGVHFSALENDLAANAVVKNSLDGIPPPSAPNVWTNCGFSSTTDCGGERADILRIVFDTPVSNVSWLFASLGPLGATFQAFDTGNILLQSVSAQNTIGYAAFGFSASGISRVDIVQDDDNWGYALDDLSFEATPVPEPTTLALLGAGLVALRARRRRSS